jgi:hypothetical protein
MRSRYPLASSLAAFAALVVFASGASAGKVLIPSKDLLTSPDDGLVIGLATVYSTGFEPFANGAIEPQFGYTASGVNLPFTSVTTASPYAGAKHLRFVHDTTVGFGTNRLVLTPSLPQPANAPSQVKMQLKISNDQGADYDVVGQAPSQGFLSWRVKFHYTDLVGGGPGTIFILDDLGAGLAFQDTGVPWIPGAYYELKVEFDPANSQIRYYYAGTLIYVGFNIYAGTSIEQLVWISDNFQLANETFDVDAIDWIDSASDPVPATNQSWGGVKDRYRK